MRPFTWVNAVLERHGLKKPDGRPLYRYRLTNDEFVELTKTLKYSSFLGVNNIVSMLMWDAAFVMYVAEWWRRYYTGQWGWEGVFDSIGIQYDQLTSAKRNVLVETGLQRWGRAVRTVGEQRRFLGTVATEGGLPLNQLQNSGAWLTHILKPTLRKHLSRGIDIALQIDASEDSIPASYRSFEIKQILVDIAQTVVALRKDYELEGKERPLLWLDEHRSNWRELFPLPMDDDQARSLLRDLIDTASRAKVDSESVNPFELERSLLRVETGTAELMATIELPAFVFLDSIGVDRKVTKIPALMVVEVYEPGGEIWSWCRAALTNYRGKVALKMNGRPFILKGTRATKQLRLRFKSDTERVFDLPLRGGESIEFDQPWLFRNIDSRWILHGIATQSIRDREALVYMPAGGDYSAKDEDTEFLDFGSLFDASIIKLSGSLTCHCGEAKYSVSTGVEESGIQFILKGRRCEYSSVPKEVFIGVPELAEHHLPTGRFSTRGDAKLLARKVGVSESWKPASQIESGYYEFRYSDSEGNVLLSRRVGVLPGDFSVGFQADNNDVRTGEIFFGGSLNFDISVVAADGLEARKEFEGGKQRLKLKVEESPPPSVTVSLLSERQNRSIELKLPYPSKGALLFDACDELVPVYMPLSLSDLDGWRIKYFDSHYNKGKRLDMVLTLKEPSDRDVRTKSVYLKRSLGLDGPLTEFFINDWRPSIDALISIGLTIDSVVEIELSYRGQKCADLVVRRYASEVVRVDDLNVRLDLASMRCSSVEALEGIEVSVLNLAQPEQNFDVLDAQSSQGVVSGEWAFNPADRKEAPWIIYPSPSSSIQFRPILWNVGEPESVAIEEIYTLQKAMQLADRDERSFAIRSVLKAMAQELDHRSWSYLRNLWSRTKHLPLATFDIWRLCISEPTFLASLFVNGKRDLIDRVEAELPLIWELVKISDWMLALKRFQSSAMKKLEDDEIVAELVQKKIGDIALLGLSMDGVAKILRSRLIGEVSPELLVLNEPRPQFLINGLSEAQQRLLIDHAEDAWPECLSNYIFNSIKELPTGYSSLIQVQHGHQTSVTFLPWVLAWQALSVEQNDWPASAEEIFQIQQLIRFDEEWFSIAYQFLSCWLSQQNMEII